ncbi:hypothetical protein M1L60_25965 [Actinoplanes sp. TRM 88003]|uniref:Uncharacterized protein n=1 Tax=Paractinoplanes aksuensis TaxID=2939490 RepID=A0ABT1DT77_9ACTN|nr:hypothetical protein [Actinoplanes aksuensis]MCO8274051.1 hypothetical protein [Actinoplanes aksuensis]
MTTVRRVLIGAGGLVMAYAVIGALTDADLKGGAYVFLVAVLVAHDAVLLPLTLAAGALIGRFVPVRSRTPVRAALLIGLAVTVVATPLVLGRGRVADNPSILPLDYGRGLLEIYAAIGLGTGLAWAVRRIRARPTGSRRRRSGGSRGTSC